jgi:hypothetical protein
MNKRKKPNWNIESRIYGDNETPKICANCKSQPQFSCKTHRCIVPHKLDCKKDHTVKLSLLYKTVECLDYEEKKE